MHADTPRSTLSGGTSEWSRTPLDRLWRTSGRVVVDVGQVFFAAMPMRGSTPAQRDVLARARADLARMRREPRAVVRPVLLLNGYHAWAGVVASLRRVLIGLTSRRPRDFLDVSYFARTNFADIRRHALDEVERNLGLETELDIVAISMGGLVARLVALPDMDGRDPRVVRAHGLFTIASPHRGAALARRVRPNATARDMHPDAPFIARLNEQIHPRLRCYALTNDRIVGATNTAPANLQPFWFPGTIAMSHFVTQQHPAILADIARHLRGEPPLLSDADASSPPRD